MGWLRRVREVVDQALRVGHVVIDGTGERALEVGVVDVETLDDELGVGLALRKDDGLAEPVATGHVLAPGHQVGERLVDGVLVEQPAVQR